MLAFLFKPPSVKFCLSQISTNVRRHQLITARFTAPASTHHLAATPATVTAATVDATAMQVCVTNRLSEKKQIFFFVLLFILGEITVG